jgi:molybdopterin-containing oxidoreductase family membrane subunit
MLFSGAYAMNFWLFEVVIGFVIPLFMLLVSMRAESVRRANLMAAASVFALVGLFVSRYDFVIIGQLITSSSKLLSGIGSGGDYMMQLASYSPNITEILTSIGLLGITWVAYLAGVRYIDLDEDEQ